MSFKFWGVPSDFVFCPAPIVAPSSVELCKNNRTKNQHSNRVASGSGGISGSQGFLFSGTSTGTNQNRNNRPPGQRWWHGWIVDPKPN